MSLLTEIKSNLNHQISFSTELIKESDWNNFYYGSSVYDTAWLSRIKDSLGKTKYPQAFSWLQEQMNKDFSYGEPNHLICFDRILSTLSAINAWYDNGEYACDLDYMMIELYNMRKLFDNKYLKRDPGIAFCLLYPSLAISLEQKSGYNLLPRYFRNKFYKKVDQIIASEIFSKPTYLAWSAEFLEPIDVYVDLTNQLNSEFSLFGSNSATAFYVMQHPLSSKPREFLEKQLISLDSLPLFSQQKHYNRLWQLLYLSDISDLYVNFYPEFEEMKSKTTKYGITMGDPLPLPDADCTAVLYCHLLRLNLIQDDDPKMNFTEFYSNSDIGFYDSFPISEKSGQTSNRSLIEGTDRFSPSVNFHLYHLFRDVNTTHGKYVIDRLDQAFDNYYRDYSEMPDEKWHVDPSYPHSRAIQTFSGYRDDLAKKSLDYFMNTINSKGYFGPEDHFCTEINAYGIIGVLHYNMFSERIDTTVTEKAIDLIVQNPTHECSLWIGKTTYNPDFVDGTILAALMYARETIHV